MQTAIEALDPMTQEILDALHAYAAVLDADSTVIAVNSRWRRYRARLPGKSDGIGENILEAVARTARKGVADAARMEARMRRLVNGEIARFHLLYQNADHVFRVRAARIATAPVRILLTHEDITPLLEARRKLHKATTGLTDVRTQHASRIDQAYEELGQRLAAIALATHVIDRRGDAAGAVATIRTAVDEARRELRVMRHEAREALDEL